MQAMFTVRTPGFLESGVCEGDVDDGSYFESDGTKPSLSMNIGN